MKRTGILRRLPALLAIPAVFLFPAAAGATVCETAHTPRDFDRLHPGVSFYEHSISKVDSAKREAHFNPELFAPSDAAGIAFYLCSDTLSYVQSATRHLFKLRDDSISYLGFENRASTFCIENPVGILDLSLDEGCGFDTVWRGRLTLYGNDYLKNARGTSRTSLSGGWSLISDTDTIKNATCARWDMVMEYFDTDCIDPGLPDSINSVRVSDLELPIGEMMRERILSRREMWFTNDARYPVLQRSRVFSLRHDGDGSCDTIQVSYFAMHYPSAYQISDTGEEPVSEKPQRTKTYGNRHGDHADFADGRNTAAVTVQEASAKDGCMEITLSSERPDGDVYLTLYTDSGIRLSETVAVKTGPVPRRYSIPLPEDVKGVVILNIESDSGCFSRKIIL